LEEVGWFDEDGDGVREADGITGIRKGTLLEMSLLVRLEDRIASERVAPIIKTNLADCGIRVNVEPIPKWTFEADGPEGPVFGRQFDLAETTRYINVVPTCENYLSFEIPDKGQWQGSNPSGYSNPDYDAACLAALQELPGTPAYEEYHKQTQVFFSEELPAVPLFIWPRIALARPYVLNFVLDATAPSELWNIETLDAEIE
jgi:peptide/nickel transport system substrate-binding protein